MTLQKKPFENIVRKGENTPFPTDFFRFPPPPPKKKKKKKKNFFFNPLPDNIILDWSKSKGMADRILKCI